MNCQEFWDGELNSLDHLENCPNCAARWEHHERLSVGLHVLGAQMRKVEAPARLERRLVSAYRAHSELAGMPRRTAWLAVGTWAAALAATAVLAVFLVRGHQPERTHKLTRSVTQLAAVEVPADLTNLPEQDGLGAFMTLPDAEDLAPNEAINLVRVELPRSSMIALGFAVSEEREAETVEADVMLGADGVARAVRFLEY
jgi:hypothetical protein